MLVNNGDLGEDADEKGHYPTESETSETEEGSDRFNEPQDNFFDIYHPVVTESSIQDNAYHSMFSGSVETPLRADTTMDQNTLTWEQNDSAAMPMALENSRGALKYSGLNHGSIEEQQTLPQREQAALLRYFTQELAQWFDICDFERHFGQVVPRRARLSTTLLNAILTASSRHIWGLKKYRNADGILEWHGILLGHVNEDTALRYHNECIRDLLRRSADPEEIRNVDLLAASIILRTDEEIYSPSQEAGASKDVFLRVTSAFMDAQIPLAAAVPHSSPHLYSARVSVDFSWFAGSPPAQHRSATSPIFQTSNSAVSPMQDSEAEGLRQACFWIALRQELHASFMTERAFTFPLYKFDSFRDLSPASDAVWADRIIIFHAAVLEYCYMSVARTTEQQNRWTSLIHQADQLEALLPESFRPIYFHERDVASGLCFPEIWYLDNCHVAAAAYIEITKILLANFDPRRPKFGKGYRASQREVIEKSKAACIKLCGMALSNRQAPPIYLNAYGAISLCGEYFTERVYQDALISFLKTTEEELAYPTSELITKLSHAWVES